MNILNKIVLIAFILIANFSLIYLSDESEITYQKYKQTYASLIKEEAYLGLSEGIKSEFMETDGVIARQRGVTGKIAGFVFMISIFVVVLEIVLLILKRKRALEVTSSKS